MWVMQVERVSGKHFEPYIEDLRTGCRFVFHEDDITLQGSAWFSSAMTDQAKRWIPRPADMERGKQIPVRIEIEPDLPDPLALHVEDSADGITYTAGPHLITEYGAAVISRKLTLRSPHWVRVPDAERALQHN